MSFKKMIAGCFGSADKIFAGHHNEVERAKDMLIEALQETDSWGEYENAIKSYLEKEDCTTEHINEQMKRVKNTEYYFNND